jgi:hypothetical protein
MKLSTEQYAEWVRPIIRTWPEETAARILAVVDSLDVTMSPLRDFRVVKDGPEYQFQYKYPGHGWIIGAKHSTERAPTKMAEWLLTDARRLVAYSLARRGVPIAGRMSAYRPNARIIDDKP